MVLGYGKALWNTGIFVNLGMFEYMIYESMRWTLFGNINALGLTDVEKMKDYIKTISRNISRYI